MFLHMILGVLLFGVSSPETPRTLYNAAPAAASLKGLDAVYVSVQCDALPRPQDGLAGDALRSEVELTLKANGIRVLNRHQWNMAPGKPYLFVRVVGDSVNPNRHGTEYFCTVDVELMQQVMLQRKPGIRSEGVTWSEATTMVLPHDKVRSIAVELQNLATDFARAVEQANPGKAAGL